MRYSISLVLVWLSLLATDLSAQSQWEVRSSNTGSSLNGVAFGNGRFVAVGDDGVILTSPSGEVWTQRVSGTTDRLPAIAFANGRFVAARANPSHPALTSPDGIDWVPIVLTNSGGTAASSRAFEAIAFGGGQFMAAGATTTSSTDVMVSADGINFHTVIPARFPAPFRLDAGLKRLIYFRGKFYGCDGVEYYASSDGVSWKRPGWFGWDVAVTDTVSKVATLGGFSPSFSIDAAHTFMRAEPPVDRHLPPSNFAPVFRAACSGAGSFVAVDSKGGVWTSIRGEYWVPKGYFAVGSEEFRSVVYDGASRFVAVGSAPAAGTALIASSEGDPPLMPAPTYHVSSLRAASSGQLGAAYGISNSGIIAGAVFVGVYELPTAAILRDGVVSTYPPSSGYPSQANAVNDNGIGVADVLLGGGAASWGMILPAGTQLFQGSGLYSTAKGVNANGAVVGWYYNDSQRGIYGYDTVTGIVTDYGNLGLIEITANAINDQGDIAGTGGGRPYRRFFSGDVAQFPNLGGAFSTVVGIGPTGDIAGYSNMAYSPDTVFEVHPFLIKDGVISDIDTLNTSSSFAFGMNSSNAVVGYFSPLLADLGQASAEHAFLSINGALRDLNALLDSSGDGWVLNVAYGINDAGWIVGRGRQHGGLSEPFLAIPISGSPAGLQTRFVNISTRLNTGTGNDVLIGGFIVRGGAKRFVIRALGGSLRYLGYNVPNLLDDPTLELLDGSGQRIAFNDNFEDLPYAERNELGGLGLRPACSYCSESAILATLGEGNYTAVVRGKDGTTGTCLVEVYNVDSDYTPGLVNISTRGPVGVGDEVMIAGFIIRGDREKRVIVKGIGPSLAALGVSNVLSDTTLEVFDQDGQIAQNDDWRSQQEAEIISSGLAPADDHESAVILSLWPGNYTAILRGKGNSVGNALVELYELP